MPIDQNVWKIGGEIKELQKAQVETECELVDAKMLKRERRKNSVSFF